MSKIYFEMFDHTEDGRPIPISIDLDVEEDMTRIEPAIDYIEKIMYGNLNFSFAQIKAFDPDSAEQIERELQSYVDKYYN